MNIKTTLRLGLAAAVFLAPNAFAERFTWEYIDARYQQPSDDNTKGFAGEVSGHISKNWVLQSRASRLQLDESALDLEMSQTRIDLSVGRVFNVGNRFSALVSAGYTRLQYEVDLGTFDDEEGDDVGNVQIALRAAITDRFEAEASAGVLFDEEDTSDVLWNAALRFRATPSVSFTLGAAGVDSDTFESDDILYEAGFRFDLRED